MGLGLPIAANARQHLRAWVPITVGASGGVRLQWVLSQTATDIWATYAVINTVTPANTQTINNNNNVVTNALADAGNHYIVAEIFILNGAVAGTIDLQFACNTAAGALVVQRGGFLSALIG